MTEETKAQSAQAAAAEEVKGDDPVAPKHEELKANADETVELMQNTHTRNITSPFINQKKAWDDENDFTIAPELVRGITEELGFIKPSNI